MKEKYICKVSKKNKKIVEFSTKGEGVGQRWVDFQLRKKFKKYKDDQNGLIRPET